MGEFCSAERDGHIFTITINRPERMNALHPPGNAAMSDLFDDPHKVLAGLKHFRHRKHEIIVFHILDPRERDFSFPREAVFEDLETGERITTLPWQIKGAYKKELDGVFEHFSRECRMSNIDYHLIDTSVSYDHALLAYLNKRARLY